MSAARGDGTARSALAAMLVAAVMIAQNLAGRALRDGFFLSNFEPSALPPVMIAASLLSVALVVGSTRVFRRWAPMHALPFLFVANALLFALAWALSTRAPGTAAVLVYLHTTSVGAVVVSGFWSVVNERFDPHTAKQLIGRIAGGATLGGVLGGLAVWQGAAHLSIESLILALAALNLACAAGVPVIGGGTSAAVVEERTDVSALTIFEETPYLRHIALLVMLAAFGTAIYDYVFKAKAAIHFGSGGELVGFFALFYLAVGVATFVAQNLLTKRSLAGLGLAANVATLPGAGCLLGPLALLFPGLTSAGMLRGGAAVLESSLYRSGYELLYTPIAPEKKRPTKALIDVGGDKLGGAAGGGFALLVLGIVPQVAEPVLLCAAIGAAVAAMFVTRDLHRGYIGSLAESLRSDQVSPDDLDTVDATTQRAVAETIASMDRSSLAAASSAGRSAARPVRLPGRAEVLARLRDTGGPVSSGAPPTAVTAVRRVVEPAAGAVGDAELAAIADLRSGDCERARAALCRCGPLPDALVGHVIELLADESMAPLAAEALRRVAPAHIGALTDVALRIRAPIAARRRITDILGAVATQRSASGLVLLLAVPEFELRFRAASALPRLMQRNAAIEVPREKIFAAVLEEALACARLWSYQTTIEGRLATGTALQTSSGRRVVHGLAYVFTLLFTVLDREPLRLAIRALGTDSPGQRGTGLEYLHNVLPPDLRAALWPLLEDRRLPVETLREESELLDEIIRTGRADGPAGKRPVDLAAVRRRVEKRRATARGEEIDD